ncbi:hypothetical protein LXL04_017241 [Taraxacum kok-saghyz]
MTQHHTSEYSSGFKEQGLKLQANKVVVVQSALFLYDDGRLHLSSIGASTSEMEKNPKTCYGVIGGIDFVKPFKPKSTLGGVEKMKIQCLEGGYFGNCEIYVIPTIKNPWEKCRKFRGKSLGTSFLGGVFLGDHFREKSPRKRDFSRDFLGKWP